jgi:predicted phosphodiesterase
MTEKYRGILFIGDPHLSSRVPGFRKDDYPRAVLGKLRFLLDQALERRLLPAILGDLFDLPRDNANWLLGEVLELLSGREVIGIHGNHDCRENSLGEDDSLSVVLKARGFQGVEGGQPWSGRMGRRPVVIGGTSWGKSLPRSFERGESGTLVFWMAHHDLKVPGYDEGRFSPREIPGVDVVVNGHIHRRLDDVRTGGTLWITPGNIARIARSDASRTHLPSALEIIVGASGWERSAVPVPHRPFEEVFHAEVEAPETSLSESAFVRGLAELEARRTESGAGLLAFLEQNLPELTEDVGKEILNLAKEVTRDAE